MAKNAAKTRASTQEHLDFEDIGDDLIIFKTGWVGLVLSTTAVNFDLLSEAEQDATIFAYGAFLNSLTFPVQILVRSKKADITQYFASLEEAAKTQANPDLKKQILKYQEFIAAIVQQKTVLDKKFYIIVNFSPLELGLGGLRKKNVAATKGKMQLVAEAKAALYPKRDHIIKQLARLSLAARQLSSQELIELFYDIYNPAPIGTQRVILDSASYTIPIVEPAVEVPTPAPSNAPGKSDLPAPTGAGPAPSPQPASTNQEPSLRPAPPPPAAGPVPEARQPSQQPASTISSAKLQPATADISQPVSQSSPLSQAIPNPKTTASEASLSVNQKAALEALQQATAQAAQFVTSQKSPATTVANDQTPHHNGAGQTPQKS